jgi:hypothetical protein
LSSSSARPGHRHAAAAAQLLTNPAEVLDAQEAVKISMERITCATTVNGAALPLVFKDLTFFLNLGRR